MSDAVRFRFRPLTWAGKSTPPEQRLGRYRFRASYSDTLDRLRYELVSLGASEAVIEADFREQDIRQDGLPRANARVTTHPGVRVAFESKHGPLIYSTDQYEVWQHNLRAIALGLEALRAVDRYGITRRGEQYTGWRAIDAAPPINRAAARLGEMAGWGEMPDATDHVVVDAAYRSAARRCHPDTGGSVAMFQELQAVMTVLRGGGEGA